MRFVQSLVAAAVLACLGCDDNGNVIVGPANDPLRSRTGEPQGFITAGGRHEGWKVSLTGAQQSLATPAVANGRVFITGGLASNALRAFNAETGQLLWKYTTADNGPTAAVVTSDYVVFSTESCELEVLNL